MDFIERLFGVSPDGGSGALEFVLLVVLFVAVVILHAWRTRHRVVPRL